MKLLKALVAAILPFVAAVNLQHRDLNVQLLPCYDYVVVGGGISGLVVANRLTEDPDSESRRALSRRVGTDTIYINGFTGRSRWAVRIATFS